jgi:quercetin dioxygenase-like cupin family protein
MTFAPAIPTHRRPVLPLRELDRVVRRIAATPELWTPHVPDPVTDRAYVRLVATSTYEAWLLSWTPGSRVSPHDHGDSAAVFAVLDGRLEDVRFSDGRAHRRVVGAGDVSAIPRGVVHDVVAVGAGTAVSLHAYSPRLSEMGFYDEAGARVDDVRDVAHGDALFDSSRHHADRRTA